MPRVAVVGAGVSGLAAAHRLGELSREQARPLKVTVLEASACIGGVLGTRDIAGYRVETGADSFITNKPWAVELCQRLGLADRLIPTDARYRRSLVLRRSRPVPVPAGFQLLTPAKVWPVLRSPIFSLRGKLRMGLEYFLPRGRATGDESLASFVRRRFGQEMLERLVQPLVGGIYTSDPEKLSLQATMPRFLDMEREYRSLIRATRQQSTASDRPNDSSGARYGLFATPVGGISEFVDALADRVREFATLRLGTPVVKLSREIAEWRSAGVATTLSSTPRLSSLPPLHPWTLTLADGTQESFDALVLAVPAWRAGELLGEVDAELSGALGEIEYASSAIVVSGHKLSDVDHPLDAFGLVVPAIEKRRILAVSFTSRKFPGRAPEGCVQLRTFVGGAMQPEELERSDAELVTLVRQELAELLGVRGEPDFTHVARWNRAMPQYHVGHLDRVAAIESRLTKHTGLELAGNAFYGVGLPDVVHSGEVAAERIWDALA